MKKTQLKPLEIRLITNHLNFLTTKRMIYISKKYNQTLQSINSIQLFETNGTNNLLHSMNISVMKIIPSVQHVYDNWKFTTLDFVSQLTTVDSIIFDYRGVFSTSQLQTILYPTQLRSLEIDLATSSLEEHMKQVDMICSTFTELTNLKLSIDPGTEAESEISKVDSLKSLSKLVHLQRLRTFGYHQSINSLTNLTYLNIFIDKTEDLRNLSEGFKNSILLKHLTLRCIDNTFDVLSIMQLTQIKRLEVLDLSKFQYSYSLQQAAFLVQGSLLF